MLILVIGLPITHFGQVVKEQIFAGNNISITIAPLSLLDIYSGSSYRFGTEAKIIKNFSLFIEGGGYFKNFNGMENVKGFIGKIEIKKYLNSRLKNVGNYISIEFSHKQQSYLLSDSITYFLTYEKNYDLTKTVNSFSIKYGLMGIEKSNFLVDIFLGIGVRFKNTNCSLTEYEMKNRIEYNDSQSQSLMNSCGEFIYPNFILGIKLGYRII